MGKRAVGGGGGRQLLIELTKYVVVRVVKKIGLMLFKLTRQKVQMGKKGSSQRQYGKAKGLQMKRAHWS